MVDAHHSTESGLSKIELPSDDPLDLFNKWKIEAKKSVSVVCLSTSSADNQPHSRHVILRAYDTSGFVFVTDSRSRKVEELTENGMRAAMCIYWSYLNDRKELVLRQARIEGTVEICPKEDIETLYNADPVYCKIRAHLCHQDAEVDWDELKKRHDELLDEIRANPSALPMPDHFVGYKLIPTWMEFYDAKDRFIADRLNFTKGVDGLWRHKRIAA